MSSPGAAFDSPFVPVRPSPRTGDTPAARTASVGDHGFFALRHRDREARPLRVDVGTPPYRPQLARRGAEAL